MKSDSYEDFVEKFKPKKTTDDCYTPENVYEAVAGWVAEEYGLDRSAFVRPFYPGGDYEAFDYPEGCAVVDNPPFSILARIKRFYRARGIPFFLFAPTLTLIGDGEDCAVAVGVNVTYENGAVVCTSFTTNMEDARMRTAPSLYRAVKLADKANRKAGRKELPKYEYPDHVVTSALAAKWCKHGVEYRVGRGESVRISAMDMQRTRGIGAFGGALLLSERAAAERAAAERAAAERAAAERAAAERAAAERAAAERAAAERAAAERAAAERAAAERWRLSPRERRMVEALG